MKNKINGMALVAVSLGGCALLASAVAISVHQSAPVLKPVTRTSAPPPESTPTFNMLSVDDNVLAVFPINPQPQQYVSGVTTFTAQATFIPNTGPGAMGLLADQYLGLGVFTPSAGSLNWELSVDTKRLTDGLHIMKYTLNDNKGAFVTNDLPVIVDNTAPVITWVRQIWGISTKYGKNSVSVSCADSGAISEVFATWQGQKVPFTRDGSGNYTGWLTVGNLVPSTIIYNYTVTAVDMGGNQSSKTGNIQISNS